MPTDWRSLFDYIGITWVDRGPNARRGNVNIACPFCGNSDPSQHLLVSETNAGFYCHRNSRHSGTNYIYMMSRLLPGADRGEIAALLNQFAVTTVAPARPKPTTTPTDIEYRWSRFRSASEDNRYIDYLHERGFDDPINLIRRYDLRYSRAGQWAMRLLIPVANASGAVVTWTGRSIADHISPRYDMPEHPNDIVYIPRPIRAVGFLVEGPMDALKIAAATERTTISPIASLGTSLNGQRLLYIQNSVRACTHLYVCPDSTVSPMSINETIKGLARLNGMLYISQFRLPAGFDDAGEMSEPEIADWLSPIT